MQPGQEKYRQLLHKLPDAFAYHQLITDNNGAPVDYVFLDVNPAFEEMIGLYRDQLIGKKISEVQSGIEELDVDRVGICSRVAVTGETLRFEQYFEFAGCTYDITAYSDAPGYFVTIFRNISGNNGNEAVLQDKEKGYYSLSKNYKQVEEELRKSEENLRTTLNSIGDAVISTDINGCVIRMNPVAETLTGWSQDEARGKPLKDVFNIIHARSRKPVVNPVERVLESGVIVGLANHTALIARDGAEYQISDSAAPIRDVEGRVTGVVLVFRDITEEYRLQEELRESEKKYRTLFEQSVSGIYIHDFEGRIIDANQMACLQLGYSKEEFLEMTVFDLHPDKGDTINLPREEILRRWNQWLPEQRFSFETEHQCKDGTVIPVQISTGIVCYKDEKILLAIVQDISERKLAEEAAAENEKRFRYIAEFSPLPISIIDNEGNYEYINPKFEEVFGYTLSEIPTGKDWFRLVHPDPNYRQEVIELWKSDFKKSGRNAPRPRTLKVVCKDGSEKDIFFWPVFMDNEKHLVIYEDVTEQKRYEQQLRYLSMHDQLTGLYNRHFLEEEMSRLDTERQLPISVIMADLNGLKLINDTYGHRTGDELLKSAADILKGACRNEDIIGRWGGDEFVIILPQTAANQAGAICNRINDKFYNAYINEVPISLAMGASTKDTTEKSLAVILQKAEDDMYKQKLAESKSTRGAVLNALLKTLETKSHETEIHAHRMLMVAWEIGEKLGLPNSELNRLNLAITLHDIGKINISEEILTKKDALTTKEWEIIKKHPETGYRIARATEEFAHVAEDILAHHERWDGSGYPRGLQRDEIPLIARIIAVADAYEVMSNGRPYKRALSRSEIAAELRRYAGLQFDPDIVKMFLTILEEENFFEAF